MPEHKCLTVIAQKVTKKSEIIALLSPLITILDVSTHADNSAVYSIFCAKETVLTPNLREILYQNRLDFALQDDNTQEKKLFLSDMDSTIVMTETIDEIAAVVGKSQQVSEITAAAMRGELDYRGSLSARLALLKGISKEKLLPLVYDTKITPNADKLMTEINRRQMMSCLISGGFSLFTDWVGNELGFQYKVANILSFDDNDRLDGHWVGELVDAEFKLKTLRRLAKDNQLDLSQTIVIGDGANDIDMVKAAGLGVAFYGKSALREVAQAEIHSGTIDNLIYFL